MSFDNVLGHERVRELLWRAVAARRIPPALLLAGPEGVGKRTLALEVARTLLCASGGGAPCNACSACGRIRRAIESLAEARDDAIRSDDPERFNHRLHPDLILVEPSPASIKIEQIRLIVRELNSRPFEGPTRVVVVDDAHLMTEQGMNTLLKSLEEPPEGTHFFVITCSPETLLTTIRSRCQMLRMGRIPDALVEEFLINNRERSQEEARLIASVAEGSLGLALAFDSGTYRGLRDQLLGLLENSNAAARLETAQNLAESDDLLLALTALRGLLRDIVALQAGGASDSLLNRDLAPRLTTLARRAIGLRAAELAEKTGQARTALSGNANRLLALDLLMDALGE